MRYLKIPVILFLVVLAGCATPPATQDAPEVRSLSDSWEAALNGGDLDALVELYSEDARLLPPNAPMGQGKDVVRGAFGAMMDAGMTGELTTHEALAAGDLAHSLGTFVFWGPDGSEADKGKFLETWQKIDGSWRITSDIWNSDLAAGHSGPTVLATHEVEDGAKWLAAWQGEDSRANQFAEHGVAGVRVFQQPDNPNTAALMIDIVDMDKFQAFLESEEGAAAKKADGVKDPIHLYAEVE